MVYQSLQQWNAYILAGGASSRMGQDKSLLTFNGTTLLQHAMETLRPLSDELAIVGNHPHLAQYARAVPDRYTGCGPLAGIHAALLDSSTEWSLLYAVDVLWRDPRVFAFLADRASNAPADCLAVVPRIQRRPEPLSAFYRKPFAQLAQAALDSGDYKIGALFPAARAIFVTEDDFTNANIASAVRNINTPQDYAEALSEV